MVISRTGTLRRLVVTATAAGLALTATGTAVADDASRARAPHTSTRLETLDRGLVAAATSEGVFLSWRLLGEEVTRAGDDGLRGPAFRVYRDGRLVATVTDSTNYLDRVGTEGASYRVAPVREGREGRRSRAVDPWAQGYTELPLRKPADGVTPEGKAYTYSVNDRASATWTATAGTSTS